MLGGQVVKHCSNYRARRDRKGGAPTAHAHATIYCNEQASVNSKETTPSEKFKIFFDLMSAMYVNLYNLLLNDYSIRAAENLTI